MVDSTLNNSQEPNERANSGERQINVQALDRSSAEEEKLDFQENLLGTGITEDQRYMDFSKQQTVRSGSKMSFNLDEFQQKLFEENLLGGGA